MVLNSNPQPPFPGGNRNNPTAPKLPLNPPTLPKQNEDSLNPRQLLSVARRRWLLLAAVTVAVGSLVATKVLREVPRYQSQFRLLVEPIAGDERFDQFSQRLAGQLGLRLDYDTQIQVLRSPAQLKPILETIQTKYPEMDYGTLVGNLQIERFGGTKLIEVVYTDIDPDRIKFVLDRLATGFIEYSKREQKTSNRKGLDFVEEQLPELKERVDRLQARVQSFRQQHNLMDPETQGSRVSERLLALKSERQGTQAELSQAESLAQTLQSQLGLELGQAITVSALSEAPRYQTLLNQLQEIETKIALERARFTTASPAVRALLKRRNNLLPLLNEEAIAVVGSAANGQAAALSASPNPVRLDLTQKLIEVTNRKQVLAVRDNALARAEQQTAQQVQEMARLTRQYTDLERQLEVATESLNRFLSVQENLQIESAQNTMSWELIAAPPKPGVPISPNLTRGMMVAAMAGLLAGMSAALLAEKLDVRLHSVDDLKEKLGLPVLGLIPRRREGRDKRALARSPEKEAASQKSPSFFTAVPRYRASPFLEAFRSLHANLSFTSPDRPLQVLTVSSSMPLEGKSTTSYYLAQAAAAMGQKVLLVDADLRRPQIHVMTDLPNVWGLSHAISMEIEVDDLIQRSPQEDRLHILTAGQIPPDPTRLLSSQKMRNLIAKLREDYDLIVFDTPPLFGLADAKFLAPHADGLVLVVRLGKTDRALLEQVLDGLRVSQLSPLGLIANGVSDYSSSSYTYYHRYFNPEGDDSGESASRRRSRSRK